MQNASTKLVVISDTHLPAFRRHLASAVRRIADESPDAILHCGDLTTLEAIDAFSHIAPIDAVAGNNDGPLILRRYGKRKIVTFAGVRIGMIHGDGSRGTTLGRACNAFAEEPVDAIVFGHSHVPYLERHGAVWVVNPGSLLDKRRQPQFSYAVICIAGRVLDPRLVFFDASLSDVRTV